MTDLVYCQNPACGKPIEKRRTESRAQYAIRKYCSRQCKGAIMEKPGGPVEGGLVRRGRNKARRLKKAIICVKCGSIKNLERHHRDGNTRNNSPSNLQILCRPCHAKVHATKGCKIPGCPEKHLAKGLCARHYRESRAKALS